MPLVSVVMPVYNGEKFLAEAIDSILTQTFADFEFIIVDDASEDASAEIIRAYEKADDRIQVVSLEENCGDGGARNAGIALASGVYIAAMDCDDVSLPNRLREQVDFLKLHPGIGLVGASARVADDSLNRICDQQPPTQHASIVLDLFCGGLALSHPTVMARRQHLKLANGYNEKLRLANDFELWWRLLWSQGVRFANLSSQLLIYRQHGASLSSPYSNAEFPNVTEIKMQALARLWGDGSQDTLQRFMRLWRREKLSWRERRKAKAEVYRLIEALAARSWIDPEDLPILHADVNQRLEWTTPRRWQQFSHWRRHRFGRGR